jgi:hypothetical protein
MDSCIAEPDAACGFHTRFGMPRRSRLEMPGVSLHLTHRGVNRAATFLDDENFQLYLSCLAEAFTERSNKMGPE